MASITVRSPRADRRDRELALRRADVIRAASAVFAEKGFQGAQVSEIAARAEFSTKTVYSLFAGKEEIYHEAIATAAGAMRESVQRKVELLDDPREQLLSLIDSLFECFDENRDILHIYSQSTHGLPWKVRQAMGESSLHHFQEFTTWVIRIAKRASKKGYLRHLDAESVAIALIGAVTTTAARWIETPRKLPISHAAPKVREVFEQLLSGRAEQ